MIRKLVQIALRRFDRRYGYDSSYLLELHDASPGAFRRFARLSAAANYRRVAPIDAYFAAKIAAVLAEDCGPCAQLCVDMAREAGMSSEQIRAVVECNHSVMSAETAAGFEFARGVLDTGLPTTTPHAEIRSRWGDGALAELALCVTTARMFPQMKRGLDHAQACARLQLDGASLQPSPLPAGA